MNQSDSTQTLTLWVGTLIDTLVRSGVRHFVVCPGSRSTPLALTVARHPDAKIWMQYDERSAGFFALGLARAEAQPAALICTSGTAVANFLPAVIEANQARVPLIVLTADRPHELRDNGAPQTIEQVGIFGSQTRWFSDLPEPSADVPLPYLRSVVARALATSTQAPAGPVHLNLPFREPLVPDRELLLNLFQAEAAAPLQLAAGLRTLASHQLDSLGDQLIAAQRGLILCGPHDHPALGAAAAGLAAKLGWPLLADPLSQVRSGPFTHPLVLSAYDAFLRDGNFAAAHSPDLVLRLGAMPTAKPVLQFLQRHPQARQIVVDGGASWREPTSLASEHIYCDEVWLCNALIERLPTDTPAQSWAASWQRAEQRTRSTIQAHLSDQQALSEPRVFQELAELLPEGATLFTSNSMPVRDLDTFFPSGPRQIRILGNRGANGIDGIVSTALGLSAAGAEPLVLVLGDLALYHDSNGLLAAKLHQLNATIILINNDGGGIFSFLPQASEQDQFERLFGTPHGLAFRPLAEFYGAQYRQVEHWSAFREAVSAGVAGQGLHIIEVRTNREVNVRDHRVIWPLVNAALAAE